MIGVRADAQSSEQRGQQSNRVAQRIYTTKIVIKLDNKDILVRQRHLQSAYSGVIISATNGFVWGFFRVKVHCVGHRRTDGSTAQFQSDLFWSFIVLKD